MRWPPVVLLVAVVFLASCEKQPVKPTPSGDIHGKITNHETGTAIPGASVLTTPTTEAKTTGSDGAFTFAKLTPGHYEVTASAAGYRPSSAVVDVLAGDDRTVDISLTPIHPTPVLEVTPRDLDFGTTGTDLVFTVTNSGSGTMTYDISASGQPWLTFSQGGGTYQSTLHGTLGTASQIVAVKVSRALLAYGSYSGAISVSAGDAGSAIIDVVMAVHDPNAPLLTLVPTRLDFGDAQTSLPLIVRNSGAGTLVWQASDTLAWFSLDRSSATTPGEVTINGSVDRSGRAPGSYSGQMRVSSNAGEAFVDVTMTIPEHPVLGVSPAQLDFSDRDTELPIVISNSGNGTLTWSAYSSDSWISVAPTNGATPYTATVRVARSAASNGLHAGALHVVPSAGATVDVPVSMLVEHDITPPAPILNLAAMPVSSSAIQLDWSAVGDDGMNGRADQILIETSLDEGATWVIRDTTHVPLPAGTAERDSVTGLTSNTWYAFRLVARDEAGNHSESNVVFARPLPATPGGLVLSAPADWTLTWVASLNNLPNMSATSASYDADDGKIYFCNAFNRHLCAVSRHGQGSSEDKNVTPALSVVSGPGYVYASDHTTQYIRRWTPNTTALAQWADCGDGVQARGLGIAPSGYLGGVIAPGEGLTIDRQFNHGVIEWTPSNGSTRAVTTCSGVLEGTDVAVGAAGVFAVNPKGSSPGVVYEVEPGGTCRQVSALLADPRAIAVDPVSGTLLVLDGDLNGGTKAVYWVDRTTGGITPFVTGLRLGSGDSDGLSSLDITSDGSRLYVITNGQDNTSTLLEFTRTTRLNTQLPGW